ncbi:MAG: DUF4190 domain-containing protein [Wenzhouxiangellaceae bacterium]|nr:DUF4190 domain-containing protein [Wenzhouxiangellaceae bacterium]
MSERQDTNPAALLSLICGILAWAAFPILGSLVAVVAGHAALGQIRRTGHSQSGATMARAGLILGWLQLALIVLAGAVWLGFLLVAGALTGLAVFVLVAVAAALVAGLIGVLAMLLFGS